MSTDEIDARMIQAGKDGDIVFVKQVGTYPSNRSTFDQWANLLFEYRKRTEPAVYMVVIRKAMKAGKFIDIVEPVDCECGSRQGARKICKHLRLITAIASGKIKYRMVMQPIFEEYRVVQSATEPDGNTQVSFSWDFGDESVDA